MDCSIPCTCIDHNQNLCRLRSHQPHEQVALSPHALSSFGVSQMIVVGSQDGIVSN